LLPNTAPHGADLLATDMLRVCGWWVRVLAWVVLPVFGLLLSGRVALAHPLGNFTVNHYSRLELNGDTLAIRYVLDLAEIPSVQEERSLDQGGTGHIAQARWDTYKQDKADQIGQQLELLVDNRQIPLQATDIVISQPLGQGDIPLVRLETWYRIAAGAIAPNVQHQATFRDRNDPARVGWREIVVHAGPGASLFDSSAPSQDVSDELLTYPDDMLQNPLDRRTASWTFIIDGSAPSETPLQASTITNRPSDPFATLVTAADLNPAVVLFALLGAASLGAIHAASPGHGKSIMAAYIVGTRGKLIHAIVLAMSVTISHTTGVLLLGILTVMASNLIVPEQLYPWLTVISGAVVLVVGGFAVLALLGRNLPRHEHTHVQDHPHVHTESAHDHGHTDVHDHHQGPHMLAPTWRNLFALGLAGGIVPSGSALVVLLSSIALGRLGFGLVLIVAFGLGMAVVLVATGVVLVHAGKLMSRWFPEGEHSPTRARFATLVPIFSAGLMILLGVAAIFQGVTQIGAPRLS
jgi:ABC-type nickel/cobalt efflux system permease component RcnA